MRERASVCYCCSRYYSDRSSESLQTGRAGGIALNAALSQGRLRMRQGVTTELGSGALLSCSEGGTRRKRRVGRGRSHRRKLAEVQPGLQTRRRRGNRWHTCVYRKNQVGTSPDDVKESTGNELLSRWSIEVVRPHSEPVLAKILKNREGISSGSPPKPELGSEGAWKL